MKNKILVIGGTGTVGSEVVNELKRKEAEFVVLTRSEEKKDALAEKGISAVVGTLGEWSEMDEILKGFDSIFLATSPAEDMLSLHTGLIDLASKHNIKKIVRLSAEPTHYSEGLYMYEQHDKADNYLKKSNIDYVILKPHYFLQNMMMHVESIKSQNMFAQYSGGAKIPFIDVRDIAKVAGISLFNDDYNGQELTLTGPEVVGYSDISKVLSNLLNKDINYVDLSYEVQKEGFKAYGLPDWQLNTVMSVFKKWEDKKVNNPKNDLVELLNIKPISIEEHFSDFLEIYK